MYTQKTYLLYLSHYYKLREREKERVRENIHSPVYSFIDQSNFITLR